MQNAPDCTHLDHNTSGFTRGAEHADQAAEVLAEVEAALETPLETATDRYVAGQPYTACALAQIAVWLREHDDATGANLIAQFAREFAAYEATTL